MASLLTNTSFNLSKEDYDFTIELAKIGYVRILSSQVSFRDENFGKRDSSHTINIKTYGDCPVIGLSLPKNWVVETISGNEMGLSIIFSILR